MRSDISLTIDQWHAGTILATFANPLKVAVQEVVAANLQTFLDDLGSILVHAVISREPDNMVDSSATVGRGSVLADMLDAPIAKLTMRDHIDTS
jgi:hypothetical protein